MPKQFYYTKQNIARMINVEGFWETVKHIEPVNINDPKLAAIWENVQVVRKYNNESNFRKIFQINGWAPITCY